MGSELPPAPPGFRVDDEGESTVHVVQQGCTMPQRWVVAHDAVRGPEVRCGALTCGWVPGAVLIWSVQALPVLQRRHELEVAEGVLRDGA